MTLLACGDDAPVTPDARPDGAPDATPDGPTFKGYDADEGGEVRVEYIIFPNGNIGTRSTAFFLKNPGTTKYFEYLNLNGCTDLTMYDKWPMAQNADRTYFDAGPSIAITGGPNTLNIPKRTVEGRDPFFRLHPANSWYFDPITSADTDGTMLLSEKTLLDVHVAGSAEFPGVSWDNAIYMPASFAINEHTTGTAMFPAGTPQTFTWTTPTDPVPAGFEVLSLVAFTSGGGSTGMGGAPAAKGPIVICVEPNDGSITVPAAMMDIARTVYPTTGTIARQTLTHSVRELVDANGPTGRRVDLLGVWCYGGYPFAAN